MSKDQLFYIKGEKVYENLFKYMRIVNNGIFYKG